MGHKTVHTSFCFTVSYHLNIANISIVSINREKENKKKRPGKAQLKKNLSGQLSPTVGLTYQAQALSLLKLVPLTHRQTIQTRQFNWRPRFWGRNYTDWSCLWAQLKNASVSERSHCALEPNLDWSYGDNDSITKPFVCSVRWDRIMFDAEREKLNERSHLNRVENFIQLWLLSLYWLWVYGPSL